MTADKHAIKSVIQIIFFFFLYIFLVSVINIKNSTLLTVTYFIPVLLLYQIMNEI